MAVLVGRAYNKGGRRARAEKPRGDWGGSNFYVFAALPFARAFAASLLSRAPDNRDFKIRGRGGF